MHLFPVNSLGLAGLCVCTLCNGCDNWQIVCEGEIYICVYRKGIYDI